MIYLFLISLWLTLILVRIGSHLLHDKENYGTEKEKSKTITKWLRKRTNFDFHHIHLGAIILIIILLSI